MRATLRERHLFLIMLVLCLVPIWLPGRYFVSGDGPCHVYNARVFLDFLRGSDLEFYQAFYQLNIHSNPNWLSHLGLALLQLFFAPEIAEKIFLTGYVLLFAFGLRCLTRAINPDSVFMATVGLLFAWHHLLQSGFYNYALSIALFFWVSGLWMHYRTQWTPKRIFLVAIVWVLLYLAHPIGLSFSLVFVGLGSIAEFLAEARMSGLRAAWNLHRRRLAGLALAALPVLLLFTEYVLRHTLTPAGTPFTSSGLLNELVQGRPLVTLDTDERGIAKVTVVFIALLTVAAIWLRRKAWKYADFTILFLAVVVWIYFQQAGSKGLELMIPQRIQVFLWLALLLWIATATFPKRARLIVPATAIALMAVFLVVRMPILSKASALVKEYVNLGDHIAPRSVVLVVNYAFNGLDEEGELITDRNWIFMHAADYLGARKPLIMSDNYEALRNYFPLKWLPEQNMYVHTAREGIDFENRPPRVDILSYNQNHPEQPIDYVLMLCLTDAAAGHPYTREIFDQLDSAYISQAVSPTGRARLWRYHAQ